MPAENRLTAEELAALAPDDVVTVESGMEFGRRRHAEATVVRVDAFHATVSCMGPRGSMYGRAVQPAGWTEGRWRLPRRTGQGGPGRLGDESASTAGARIQELFRTWNRNRGDVEALQELQAAIGACLEAQEHTTA